MARSNSKYFSTEIGDEPKTLPRAIRPSKSGYIVTSAIAGLMFAAFGAIHIFRGAQTNAWHAMVIIVLLWAAVMLFIRSRTVVLAADRLSFCGCWIAWDDISHSAIDHYYYLLMVYNATSPLPIVRIPLSPYSRADVEFLLRLDCLRVR